MHKALGSSPTAIAERRGSAHLKPQKTLALGQGTVQAGGSEVQNKAICGNTENKKAGGANGPKIPSRQLDAEAEKTEGVKDRAKEPKGCFLVTA